MKFIKICNKGTSPRRALEVLGFGFAKNNAKESIGIFETGFKIASTMALRLGIKVAFSSADDRGPYMLTFGVTVETVSNGKETKTLSKLRYIYDDGTFFDSGRGLEAFKGWQAVLNNEKNTAYPIVREGVANARDEDPNYTIEYDVPKIEQAPAGYSALYIEQTKEVLVVLRDSPEKYFKFRGAKPIFEAPGIGAVYAKTPNRTRFFVCGYLASTEFTGIWQTLFDYDIYDRTIFGEYRGIKNRLAYFKKAGELLTNIKDEAFVMAVLKHCVKNPKAYELVFLKEVKDFPQEFKDICLKFWQTYPDFGEEAVLATGKEEVDRRAEHFGFKVVSPRREILLDLFKKAGIPDSAQAAKSRLNIVTYRRLTPEERKKVKEALVYFCGMKYFRDNLGTVQIGAFKDIDNPKEEFFGLAIGNKIYLNEKLLRGEMVDKDGYELPRTINHELAHYISGAGDLTQKFEDVADKNMFLVMWYLKKSLDRLRTDNVKVSEVCDDFVDDTEIDFFDIEETGENAKDKK